MWVKIQNFFHEKHILFQIEESNLRNTMNQKSLNLHLECFYIGKIDV